ncbi:hypothetical protein AB1278_17530 [Chryseobacterium sp. NRRL B-14798]|uniref:tetratricopeptide repeat protein n=1 Tax=Chryseobacterium sp. NRRL B-14798 TaxID=3162880 RepID=UPI003D249A49
MIITNYYINFKHYKVISILLLFTHILLGAQKYTIQKIDSLQKYEVKKLYDIGNLEGKILLEKKLIKESQKIGYQEGAAKGYIGIAATLCGLMKNKESFEILEYVSKHNNIKNKEILTRLHIVYGRNYYALGLYEKGLSSFDEAIKYSREIKNEKLKNKQLYYIYEWKRSSFEKLDMKDSACIMERLCMKSPTPMLFVEIADKHIALNQLDSAKYYLKKAETLRQAASSEGKSNVLRGYGKLYLAKKEYSKALASLFSSLKISKRAGLKKRDQTTYKLLAETYKELHNVHKQNEYLQKYSNLTDSLYNTQRKALAIPIEILASKHIEKEKKTTTQYTYIIISVISASITVVLIINFIRQGSRKRTITGEANKIVVIVEKKSNLSVNEIVEHAINGDPVFILKFREYYPEFYNTLTFNYSELTLNDMKFIAYVKLKFSNKEIAQYGNMSIRTVESKKYRLRKKLKLPADTDFNQWIWNQ